MNEKEDYIEGTICVEVTQEDIEKGIRRSHTSCPIATAVRRVIPSSKYISITRNRLNVGTTTWDLPEDAREFILKFDEEESVEPFSFDIEADEAY